MVIWKQGTHERNENKKKTKQKKKKKKKKKPADSVYLKQLMYRSIFQTKADLC